MGSTSLLPLRAFRPWVLNQPGRILTAYAIYTPSDGSSRRLVVGLVLLTSLVSISILETTDPVNEMWVGIGYYYTAYYGGSDEGQAAIGALGVYDSVVMGTGFGWVFGLGVGAAVGAGGGL